MLRWQGSLPVSWPGREPANLKVQLWCSSALDLSDLTLEFATFVRPNLVPLHYFRGTVLNVYSDESTTIQYFGELASSNLWLLAKASTSDKYIDHLLVYTQGDPKMRVYARPLQLLSTRREFRSGSVSAASSPALPAVPQPRNELSPKVLQQVVSGALRMRGCQGDDYKYLYSLCFKTVDYILRNKKVSIEMVQEKVEGFLALLD